MSGIKTIYITRSGGNVLADLGFGPEEAAALKAKSQRIIAEKLAIKESSFAAATKSVKTANLKQTEVSEILGATFPPVNQR